MRGGMEGVWGGEEGEGGVMGLKEWGGLRSGVRGEERREGERKEGESKGEVWGDRED